MSIVWLIIIIILAIIEIATINLVTIWFVASGLVSLILSYFNTTFLTQFAVFVILGTLLLILTRKSLVKMLNKNKQKTNLDLIIDSEGIVTENITKNNLVYVTITSNDINEIIDDLKIETIYKNGNTIKFKNNILHDKLIKKLAKYKIEKILIEEPTLEDIFIHYYEKEV